MDINNIRVGDSTSFNFLPPYDSILSDKTVYEVTNLSTLKSLVNKNYKPYETIYVVYGLDELTYESDLEKNIVIVELTLGSKTYYVPINKITDKEIVTNVHYSERIIGIKLGFIPDDEDLTNVKNEITILVKDMLGIESKVDDTTITSVISIPEEEHIQREDDRELLKGEYGNYKKLYYDLKEFNSRLIVKLRALESTVLKIFA